MTGPKSNLRCEQKNNERLEKVLKRSISMSRSELPGRVNSKRLVDHANKVGMVQIHLIALRTKYPLQKMEPSKSTVKTFLEVTKEVVLWFPIVLRERKQYFERCCGLL